MSQGAATETHDFTISPISINSLKCKTEVSILQPSFTSSRDCEESVQAVQPGSTAHNAMIN